MHEHLACIITKARALTINSAHFLV